MQDIYIPTLHTFENSNIFTGSYLGLRFKVTPDVTMLPGDKEVDVPKSSMKAEYWHGLYCYEKSEIEDEKVFPLTPEGREEMTAWLLEHV